MFCSGFLFIWYILDPIYWNSLENLHKVEYNWHLKSATSPTFRFPVQIYLNPMFHCNTRHSYYLNGLKSTFIVWRIDQVFVIMSFDCVGFLHKDKKNILKNTDFWKNDVIMTSSRRHHGVYPIVIKFHDTRANTFSPPPRPKNSKKAQAE